MPEHSTPRTQAFSLALILSGGNALGSYQAGAYQALSEHGFAPDWVLGASAGAINGAIICGNSVEQALSRLAALWRPSCGSADVRNGWRSLETARRTRAAAWTLAGGRRGLFSPRSLLRPLWNPWGDPVLSSLYDTSPLLETLEELVDFERLNRGTPRFSATAVDIESGEDLVFDTQQGPITPEHLRASSALLPIFSPVEIGGRLLGDGGLSANLPLDLVLGSYPGAPLLCLAIDLLPLTAPRPHGLGEMASRAQDLMFATQSRRTIAAWQTIFKEREQGGAMPSITLLHVSYAGQDREVGGKGFDFSPQSAAMRWRRGYEDLSCALTELAGGAVGIGQPGLMVHSFQRMPDGGAKLTPTHFSLQPKLGFAS